MIDILKNALWSLRYPWPRSVVEGRLRPLRMSLFTENHLEGCMILFSGNEANGVPPDDLAEYLEALRGPDVLTLVAEDGGRVVGTFGIQYGSDQNTFWLCYMLTSANCHRQGIGTTMFLAALALLPDDHADLNLWISALPSAVGFYCRFGFRRVGEHQHPSGQMHQVAFLPVTSATRQSCRSWLVGAGVFLPEALYEIPTANAAEQTGVG